MRQFVVISIWLAVNLAAIPAFSQANKAKSVRVEVKNVIIDGGTVHISVFLSEKAYKNQTPDFTFQLAPSGSAMEKEISMPLGDCVIDVYQDVNNNGKCDKNLLGIPKEPVGITNWNGKGAPGNFDKLKTGVTPATQTISISLFKL